MKKGFKLVVIVCLIFACTNYLISCATTTAVRPTEATHKKGAGRLITNDGLKFPYEFYPLNHKGPSIIYIPGMGGRVAWRGQGGYALASPLNKAGFNFIGFNRAGNVVPASLKDAVRITAKRGKSGSVYFPTKDGKESATENIVRNEVKAVIEFIEKAPTHDPNKGIYLIGASMGSWASLCTVHSFPDKIKGVVFLSPSLLPEWVSAEEQIKRSDHNLTNYFESLTKTLGQRPALAIGSKTDIIAPHMSKTGSALDGAQLLQKEIGPNVEVMEVSSSLHSGELVSSSRKVREKIVQWLVDKAYGE